MGRALRAHLDAQGDGLAGFALVSWDGRGGPHTTFFTETGPVAMGLMPCYVADALNRHVALELAKDAEPQPLPGGS